MEPMLNHRQLRWQATKGLVGMLLFMGLLISVLAGTFDYWQGWAYLSLFACASVVTSAYFLYASPQLVERRLHAGPMAEKELAQKIIQACASLLFVAIIAVPALDRRFGWSHVAAEYSVAALVVFLIGYLVMAWVFHENSFAASTVQVFEGQTVVTTGPYRLVRHPMYLGGLLSFLVTPIALGSWWGMIPAVALMFPIIARLQHEERYLSQHLQGYDAYRAKTTTRLIPGIW